MSCIPLVRVVLMLLLASGLAACQEAAYYSQALQGQMALIIHRKPIDRLIAAPDTDPVLRQQLEIVQRIRRFAGDQLGLPANKDFASYVELGRPYPVWSVMAAPELSLAPYQWCYWVVGCLDYRGYFSAAGADQLADSLRKQGFDVYVGGVPAYSTLGWLNDPVLSSYVREPEPELAEMIFHELAHVQFFIPGDTVFNESFAVTVATEGLRRYSLVHPVDVSALQLAHARQAQFVSLVLNYRSQLQAAFAAPGTDAQKRADKQRIYAALQAAYVQLRTQWGGYAGYDNWFSHVNNASLNTVAIYYDEVPALQALLAKSNHDLPAFYAACRALKDLSPQARRAALGTQ